MEDLPRRSVSFVLHPQRLRSQDVWGSRPMRSDPQTRPFEFRNFLPMSSDLAGKGLGLLKWVPQRPNVPPAAKNRRGVSSAPAHCRNPPAHRRRPSACSAGEAVDPGWMEATGDDLSLNLSRCSCMNFQGMVELWGRGRRTIEAGVIRQFRFSCTSVAAYTATGISWQRQRQVRV